MKQHSREERFFISTEEPEDIQVVRTTDEFLYDSNGKRYIDFNAGWCVGNLGWRRKEIQSKINEIKLDPDYQNHIEADNADERNVSFALRQIENYCQLKGQVLSTLIIT